MRINTKITILLTIIAFASKSSIVFAQSRFLAGASAAVFNEPVPSDKFIPSIGGGVNLLWRRNETKRFIPFIEVGFSSGAFVDRYLSTSRMLHINGGFGVRIAKCGVFGVGTGIASVRTTAGPIAELNRTQKDIAEWTTLYWQVSWFTNREGRWQYGASWSKSYWNFIDCSQATVSIRYTLF